MKIIPFYLPQFHNIPENDEWWGDGFTEWTNMKAATPIYPGHDQPKIPLNDNYYDLTDDNVKIWQAQLAKQYGIYGFCYYHYWFNGKMLLEKPMEQMLENPNIDIPFCICWTNEPWTKAWVGTEKKVLVPQKYGNEPEWKEHFEYFIPFFKDTRYMKENNKPIIIIYRPYIIPCLKEMLEYWKKLAVETGFEGLTTMCVISDVHIDDSDKYELFDSIIEWQPHMARSVMKESKNSFVRILKKARRKIINMYEERTGKDWNQIDLISKKYSEGKIKFLSYDDVWKTIINMKPLRNNSIPGSFVRWDNSPRYHKRATIIRGESPQKFKKYLSNQIKHAKKEYKSDMLFMFAWNEWCEGGYLEPDESNRYEYLEAIKAALVENGELPINNQ